MTEPDAGERTIRPALAWEAQATFTDVRYETAEAFPPGDASVAGHGGGRIAKITIARPEVLNAFRPRTVEELAAALEMAQEDTEVGVIVLCGEGSLAFCSGGDQRARGDSGYVGDDEIGRKGVGRFLITDVHVQIRRMPKPVVAMVAGYAIGGGHVLHVICDLTIAADNARFGQTGPRVGSFDGGFGASVLARQIGQKRAK